MLHRVIKFTMLCFHTVHIFNHTLTANNNNNKFNNKNNKQHQTTTNQPDKQELHQYWCDSYAHRLKSCVLMNIRIWETRQVGSEAPLVLEKDSCDFFDALTTTNNQPDKLELHQYWCDSYAHRLKSCVLMNIRIWDRRQVGFEA
jgi:hypothetical protein